MIKTMPKEFEEMANKIRTIEPQDDRNMGRAEKAKLIAMSNIDAYYYTSENMAYVRINLYGESEIVSTNSQAFKHWLVYMFSTFENSVLPQGDIKTVVSSIEAKAYFEGQKVDIYLRIAELDNKIYLDLCNKEKQVLEISADGFQVLDESPVLFRRTEDMAEIPVPILESNTDYTKLSKYLNYSTIEDLNMIVAYILASFRPVMPKPILNLTGEAGTGKSMNTRLIRKFIDPAKKKDLLKKEIDEQGLTVTANSQYLMAFDNLSGISKEGSDLLCVVSTGGVTTKKKLYTDTDEIIVDLKKTVILNGIEEISKRQDLVSRTIFVETPRLEPTAKKTESEIWTEFNKDYPYILGSLVNAVSIGLKNKGNDQSIYSRMIDFGRYIAECSEGLEWEDGYWQATYQSNQEEGIEQSIDSDPFASALVDYMEGLKEEGTYSWEGTASNLLDTLIVTFKLEDVIYNNAWPKQNKVKTRLRRIAPLLDKHGIRWTPRRSGSARTILINIDGVNDELELRYNDDSDG